MGCPASSLACTLWAQVACRSVQAFDDDAVGADAAGHYRRLPLVVAEWRQHGPLTSGLLRPFGEEQDPAGQLVVAVLEHRGRDA